jgi:membrane protease YdiL (CAAX protease family)
MIPWRPVAVFITVSAGATTAIAALAASRGWTVQSPVWVLLAPLAMWAPALARFVTRRTVDRAFERPLRLSRWGTTGARVVLMPLAVPLAVYGVAYFIGCFAGLASWSPGGGRWTTNSQIVMNLVVNLTILGAMGTVTALGEELGWRGYLQPRLDAAGVRVSVIIVWFCQLLYHAPLIAGAGYASSGGLLGDLARFAAADLALTFMWAAESYRAVSLWPAVFFHSFHNTISQWLFPRFFAGGDNELWLGETGFLPAAIYVVAGVTYYAWLRWRGPSWRDLVQRALNPPTVDGQGSTPISSDRVTGRERRPAHGGS